MGIQAHVRSDGVAAGDFVHCCKGGQVGNKEKVKEEFDQAGFMPDME
jgi:hypothetical protein